MILRSEKTILRSPSPDDLPYIRKLWADPGTMKDVGGPVVMDEEKSRRWFERMVDPGSATDRYFLICGADGNPLGEASFHRYDPVTKTAELNIKIEAGKRYLGHGPEGLRLLLNYFFGEFGGEMMLDPIAFNNTNGLKAIKRFGFELDYSRKDVFMLKMAKQRFYMLFKEG
jgi:RimJ/RimL family protein N-acetyltransferase